MHDPAFSGVAAQKIDAVVACDPEDPAGDRECGVIGRDPAVRSKEHLVSGVFGLVDRVQQVPAEV